MPLSYSVLDSIMPVENPTHMVFYWGKRCETPIVLLLKDILNESYRMESQSIPTRNPSQQYWKINWIPLNVH